MRPLVPCENHPNQSAAVCGICAANVEKRAEKAEARIAELERELSATEDTATQVMCPTCKTAFGKRTFGGHCSETCQLRLSVLTGAQLAEKYGFKPHGLDPVQALGGSVQRANEASSTTDYRAIAQDLASWFKTSECPECDGDPNMPRSHPSYRFIHEPDCEVGKLFDQAFDRAPRTETARHDALAEAVKLLDGYHDQLEDGGAGDARCETAMNCTELVRRLMLGTLMGPAPSPNEASPRPVKTVSDEERVRAWWSYWVDCTSPMHDEYCNSLLEVIETVREEERAKHRTETAELTQDNATRVYLHGFQSGIELCAQRLESAACGAEQAYDMPRAIVLKEAATYLRTLSSGSEDT